MTRAQRARLDTFRRGQKFGQEYQSRFPGAAQSAPAFEALSTIIGTLETNASTTVASARAGRDSMRAARQELTRQLNGIARMARVIARTTPGFDGRFGRPRLINNAVVMATAQAFLRDAEPVAATFVAQGLPADFLATLQSGIAEFEAAMGVRNANRLARASAHAGIREAIRQGRAAMARIDVLVRYHCLEDAEVMAAWERARRIDGQPQAKARAVTPDPTTAVAPAA